MTSKSKNENSNQNAILPFPQETKPLEFAKSLRQAVSDEVGLTKLEQRIVDSPEFQRLRRVKQLGLAYLVYPTAVHTRFDHSLGVMKMAGRMLHHIEQNSAREKSHGRENFSVKQEHRILTRLYGLLHDVTHIPFGHTLEDELHIFERHDENFERIDYFIGEDSNIAKIIRDELGDSFGRLIHKRLLKIYTWNKEEDLDGDEFIYDIVSNTVCADLLDYLERDNYFCNLPSVFGTDLIRYLHVQEYQGRQRVFVRIWKANRFEDQELRKSIRTDLSRLLEARCQLAECVYFHHTKIVGSAMLGRAVQEAQLVQHQDITEQALYNHGDETFLYTLSNSDVPVTERLARGLWDRRLHKVVHVLRQEDFAATANRHQVRSLKRIAYEEVTDPKTRRDRENEFAELIGADQGDVLLYAVALGGNKKPAELLVEKAGEKVKLMDVDDRIIKQKINANNEMHDSLWGIYTIASDKLNSNQVSRLRDIASFFYTSLPEERSVKLRHIYVDLIEHHFLKNYAAAQNPPDFIERRDKAADEFVRIASQAVPLEKASIRKTLDMLCKQFLT